MSTNYRVRTSILTLALTFGLVATPGGGLQTRQAMDLDELLRPGDVYLHPGTSEPYSGPVERRWPGEPTGQSGGILRERGTSVEGRWDGVHEWYHLSGELATRETYCDGQANGPSETYFKTGQLSATENYADGHLSGPYESYWHRGRLAERGEWSEGEPCGIWFSFGRTVSYPPCPDR
jgi:hypothetical protein